MIFIVVVGLVWLERSRFLG